MIGVPMKLTAHADVLIVDDHPLYRDGVLQMLARRAPNFICRVASDAGQALAALQPPGGCDLVIADQRLPGELNGMALLARVGVLYPTAGRVLVSGSDDPRLPALARQEGVMGFLPKVLEPDLWIQALAQILAGEPWFPLTHQRPARGLTRRQASILERIATGQTNKIIARDLGVTERTIKYHLSEIFARSQATSRAEAVARALALGWINPSMGGR